MRYKTKLAILSMIKALKRFESCQSKDRVCDDDWNKLSLYMAEHGQVTWNEISAFRERLIEFFIKERR